MSHTRKHPGGKSQHKHGGAEPADEAEQLAQAAAAAATAEQAAGPEIEELRKALAQAQAEAADFQDKYVRARAEADNVRRRAESELANAHKYAIEKFAAEVLAVKDSLELAKAVDFEQDNRHAVEKMLEGLDLTIKLLDSIFDKFALQAVEPRVGDKFDPDRHQAMGMLESDEVPPNHIVNVVQKGYMLNDRLLRPAMVMVAKARSGA
jgi:molecular chaperone GrpE